MKTRVFSRCVTGIVVVASCQVVLNPAEADPPFAAKAALEPIRPVSPCLLEPVVPCPESHTVLRVCFYPNEIYYSLYQSIALLEANVSGGTPPYSYDWDPTTLLDVGSDYAEFYAEPYWGACCLPDDTCVRATGPIPCSALGGTFHDGCCEISSCPDTFPPCGGVGDYTITLTVTDSADPPAVVSDQVVIHVDDSVGLVVDAGYDVVASQGDEVLLTAQTSGGDGDFSFYWSPRGIATGVPGQIRAPTDQDGTTTYTVTCFDGRCKRASDSVDVTVLPACDDTGCIEADYPIASEISAEHVVYDPDYGTEGQAVVYTQATEVRFIDLATGVERPGSPLILPADGRGLAIDPARRRAFATTSIQGEFTKSVAVIDLDTMAMTANIALSSNIAAARGMAVIPSTGNVVVACMGVSDGVFLVDPSTATLVGALQNVHHPDSFRQPVDVAVLEENGLSVAVVANSSQNEATLVPLADITFTPDTEPPGGPLPALPTIVTSGNRTLRAIAADPDDNRVVVGSNSSTLGYTQVLTITSNSSGFTGPEIALLPVYADGGVADQGIDIDPIRNEAYIACYNSGGTRNSGVVVVDLALGTPTNFVLDDDPDPNNNDYPRTYSAAAKLGHNTILMVGRWAESGIPTTLSERCPCPDE